MCIEDTAFLYQWRRGMISRLHLDLKNQSSVASLDARLYTARIAIFSSRFPQTTCLLILIQDSERFDGWYAALPSSRFTIKPSVPAANDCRRNS